MISDLDLNFPVKTLDKYNNHIFVTHFENELAKVILEFLPSFKTVFAKVNEAILKYLHENKLKISNEYFERSQKIFTKTTPAIILCDSYKTFFEDIFTAKNLGYLYSSQSTVQLAKIISQAIEIISDINNTFFTNFSTNKSADKVAFFNDGKCELLKFLMSPDFKAIIDARVSVAIKMLIENLESISKEEKDFNQLAKQVAGQLNELAKILNTIYLETNKQSSVSPESKVMKLHQTLRPDKFFNQNNRGRGKSTKNINLNYDFGISDSENIQKWAKDYHLAPFMSAKDAFKTDENSPIVQFFRQHNLPFISGPSGSFTFILPGILLLEPNFDSAELRDFISVYIAMMIAEGHHGIAEGMMVACELGLYDLHVGGEKVQLKFPFQNPISMYDHFIPDRIKNSQEIKFLVGKYPDFFMPNARNFIRFENFLSEAIAKMPDSEDKKMLFKISAHLKKKSITDSLSDEIGKVNEILKSNQLPIFSVPLLNHYNFFKREPWHSDAPGHFENLEEVMRLK